MIDFIKSVLIRVAASLVAIIIVFIIFAFIYGAFFIAATQPVPVEIEDDTFLVMSLDRSISDAPPQFTPQEAFFGAFNGREPGMNLLGILDTIHAAKSDDRIAGIFVAGNVFSQNYGSGLPVLSELRNVLEDFKTSGKKVIGFLESADLSEFYLYSVLDELYMHPMGSLSLPGLATENPYFGEALERLGVGAQIVRVGDYKSAVEPFIASSMSRESREQMSAMIEDVWSRISVEIAQARGIEVSLLNDLISYDPLVSADEAMAADFVDGILYYDEVLKKVAESGASDMNGRTFKQMAIEDYAASLAEPGANPFEEVTSGSKPTVAIVYAEGDIVDGDKPEQNVPGDWLARQLRDIRYDDSVEALVLRVNSPGGSAYASEVILRELELISEEIPVVISMGTLAASGGYWISTANDIIIADPNTITGSIGVFGILFNFKDLINKWGIYFDGVETHPYGSLFSAFEKKTPEALALVQQDVDSIYEDFLERVTNSTGIDDSDVLNALAGGRVWTGSQALELGLVDRLGGLNDAIDEALELAGLTDLDYSLREVPGVQSPQEMLLELLSGGYDVSELGLDRLFDTKHESIQQVAENLQRLSDLEGVQARSPIVGFK
ncbi:MAG: signal peptide peptidase SppA [Verrucomicrobiota bacterium]